MALQKPEWFKVDPGKFLSDSQVDAMTTEELGACFRLLCRQWIDGSLPDDLHMLGRLCRLDATRMGEAWVTLCHFFPTISEGKRANRFMWVERDKVLSELERKSDEGTRAANKRWDEVRKRKDAEPNGSPMQNPMGHPMQEQSRAEQNQTRPELPPSPKGDLGGKRKRRTMPEKINDLEIAGFPSEAIKLGIRIMDFWPKQDGQDERKVGGQLDLLIPRLVEINSKQARFTWEVLEAAGRAYCASQRTRFKAPEHFFTKTPDVNSNGKPPFLEWATSAAHKIEALAKKSTPEVAHA